MIKIVSQKEALELVTQVTVRLLESTRNKPAQTALEAALERLSEAAALVKGNGIPEMDPVLLTENTNRKVTLELE